MEQANLDPPNEITLEQTTEAIKSLKTRKSCGPDNIPNEVFIKANTELREEYTRILNIIHKNQTLPEKWAEGEIKRIYKNKGIKGKCINERGITLASNFGKLYERIINKEAIKEVNMSDAQAGGMEGRSTVDHLLILKELINTNKENKQKTYLAFLDVTKAYDKAWLDAIMYVMEKEGLKSKLWTIIKKLNQNLTAKIKTKHGLTNSIKLKDSIRQGGVLSVVQYSLMMDEIAKEIKKENLGIQLPGQEEKIGCLLWVDDVVLMSSSKEELQKMLDITNEIANRYHLEFGKEKSQTMIINGGRKKNEANENFKLGNMTLDNTNKYKYLGEYINAKNNLDDQLQTIRAKTEAAYQTIMLLAGDNNFREIEMKCIWRLLETCITPILLYGSETWQLNKGQTKEVNRIYDNIIRRILKVPPTTPREALYMETGLLDPETMEKKRKLGMKSRLEEESNNLLKQIIDNTAEKGWSTRIRKTMEQLEISPDNLEGSKYAKKHLIKKKDKQIL